MDVVDVWVPEDVELDTAGEALVWGRSVDPQYRYYRPDPHMLNRFTRLGDAPAEQILDFARRYGVLVICEHGQPASHSWGGVDPDGDVLVERALREDSVALSEWDQLTRQVERCAPRVLGEAGEWWGEPIERWRNYAREARGMLIIAEHHHRGELAKRSTWELLGETAANRAFDEAYARLTGSRELNGMTEQRSRLVARVEDWLRLSATRPAFEWQEGQAPRVRLYTRGLFGALAMQLLTAVTKGGIAYCSACHLPYTPNRAPSTSRDNYCPDCGRRAAMRNASAKYRRKQRAQAAGEPAV